MKTFYSASAILVLICASVFVSGIYTARSAEHILKMLDEMPAVPCEEAKSKADKICEYAESRFFIVNLSVGHSESENIFSKLNELTVRSLGNEYDYLSALASLRDSVEYLKSSETFSLSMLL